MIYELSVLENKQMLFQCISLGNAGKGFTRDMLTFKKIHCRRPKKRRPVCFSML